VPSDAPVAQLRNTYGRHAITINGVGAPFLNVTFYEPIDVKTVLSV